MGGGPGGRRGARGRAGGPRTHLHTPQSGRARAAGAPARSAADSCCSSAAPPQPGPGGGEAGRPEAGKGASRGPCVRASGRGARVALRLRRGLAACRARSPLPLLQPPSPAAGQRGQAGLRERLRGPRQALSKRLAARPRLQLPVAHTASENAPRSLQGLHFVACGLAASPLGHVVIGRPGGGAGRGRGSEPPAPPPSQHAFCSPRLGARGNLEVAPQQRRHGRSDNPQPLPGQCPPGRGPEGFRDLKDFKHRKHLGRWRGTLNPFSPRFLKGCQGTWALQGGPGPGCPHSSPPPLTGSLLLPLPSQDPPFPRLSFFLCIFSIPIFAGFVLGVTV